MTSQKQYIRQQCIHESEDTRVYLVKHRILKDTGIEKCICRTSPRAQSLVKEAKILRQLNCPQIPRLYDYREDDNEVCLTEEYIEGTSLAQYLTVRENIPLETAIGIICGVGEILCSLHSHRPYPVLYLDLKPEHIILKEDKPFLIDFGMAAVLNANTAPYIGGTPDYAAPEQLEGGKVDERSDLYALGQVAKRLMSLSSEGDTLKIRSLINRAIAVDPNDRPKDVGIWLREWKRIKPGDREGDHTHKRIAVIGTDRGVGTTHIAICACVALNHMGIKAIYVDKSNSNGTQCILRNRREFVEREGLIYHGSFMGAVAYGPAIAETTLPDGTYIFDCGNDAAAVYDADMYLYVCGTRPWRDIRYKKELVGDPHCYLMLNPPNRAEGVKMARVIGQRLYAFPLDADPFGITREKQRLFGKIFTKEGLVAR